MTKPYGVGGHTENTPMPGKIFVHPLRRSERKSLEHLAKHARDARQVNRARAILLSNQGKSLLEIAELLDMPPTCVATWIRRYEAEGIEGLADKPRAGRPRKATPEFELRLLELVEKPPQEHDATLPFSVWTVELLILQLVKEGYPSVCDDTVRNALHRLEFAYLRPKLDLTHKQDPLEIARFKRRLRSTEKNWMRLPA